MIPVAIEDQDSKGGFKAPHDGTGLDPGTVVDPEGGAEIVRGLDEIARFQRRGIGLDALEHKAEIGARRREQLGDRPIDRGPGLGFWPSRPQAAYLAMKKNFKRTNIASALSKIV